MTLFVREYSWMWQRLGLSLAECRVYAYIYGLTHGDKRGYDGTKRGLATLLGLTHTSVNNILDSLTEKNLISYTNNVWQSVSSSLVDNGNSVSTDNGNSLSNNGNSVAKNGNSFSSPHTPLYNNIKDKNKQADMQTDFEKFYNYFSVAMPPEYQNRRAATQMIFEARSKAAQKAIIEAAKEGAPGHPGDNPNPYFFVQDFPEPKPHNYNGDPRIDELLKAHKVASAEYNGKFGMYSLEDIELFHLRRPKN